MSKVKTFRILSNSPKLIVESILMNLRNGWSIDNLSQNNSDNSGIKPKNADYFFFHKKIEDKDYSICLNCFERELTCSFIKNIHSENISLSENEWNTVIKDFIDSIVIPLVKVDWEEVDYTK